MVKMRKREKRKQQHGEQLPSKARTQQKPEDSEKDYKGNLIVASPIFYSMPIAKKIITVAYL